LRVRLTALLIVALAIAAAASGCGGGGDDSGSSSGDGDDATAASISKAEFIKETDAICTQGGKRTQAKFVAFLEEKAIPEGQEPSTEQVEEIGTKIMAPALEEQAEEVRQLGFPAGDEEQIEAFLAGVEEAIEKIEEEPKLAKSADKLLTKAHQAIAGYGFKVCGPEEK
jgi:hypothetical protein